MVNNSKNAFWQALVFTIIVFLIGMAIGFFIEISRSVEVEGNIYASEVDLLDQSVRNGAISDFNVSCALSRDSLFTFADKIYGEAAQLEKYHGVSKFANSLTILHKRYDLMRVMVWSESIDLKKRCNQQFHTAVYFYGYDIDDIQIRAKENTYARLLADMKELSGNELLLIPIAANLNLSSVDILMKSYNVTGYPTILIDEKILINDSITFNELRQAIFDRNK